MTKKNRKKRKLNSSQSDNIDNKETESKNNIKKPEVPVVVFKSAKKSSNQQNLESNISDNVTKTDDFNDIKTKKLLNKLQWDVTAFGLKGFSTEERRKLERNRAVKLGAKAPKRKYVNYKTLLEEKKHLKTEENTKKESDSEKNKISKKSSVSKNPMFWNENPKKATKIGKYKSGMLKLTQKEINKIKSL